MELRVKEVRYLEPEMKVDEWSCERWSWRVGAVEQREKDKHFGHNRAFGQRCCA